MPPKSKPSKPKVVITTQKKVMSSSHKKYVGSTINPKARASQYVQSGKMKSGETLLCAKTTCMKKTEDKMLSHTRTSRNVLKTSGAEKGNGFVYAVIKK